MARCDVASAKAAGVSCSLFYMLQHQVTEQVASFRADLRRLPAAAAGAEANSLQTAAARLDKYMGKGTSQSPNKIALVHNVLTNAERQLRSPAAPVLFDPTLKDDAITEPGRMLFSPRLSRNLILHEAIHFGTAVYRSRLGVLPVLDQGTVGFYSTYGSLPAALHRARYGWSSTSVSAASYAWLVTGP